MVELGLAGDAVGGGNLLAICGGGEAMGDESIPGWQGLNSIHILYFKEYAK